MNNQPSILLVAIAGDLGAATRAIERGLFESARAVLPREALEAAHENVGICIWMSSAALLDDELRATAAELARLGVTFAVVTESEFRQSRPQIHPRQRHLFRELLVTVMRDPNVRDDWLKTYGFNSIVSTAFELLRPGEIHDLAREFGIASSTLARWRYGESEPSALAKHAFIQLLARQLESEAVTIRKAVQSAPETDARYPGSSPTMKRAKKAALKKSAAPAVSRPRALDASAFAPSKFRKGLTELVRVVIHRPDQRDTVAAEAAAADARARLARSTPIGAVAHGEELGVSIETHGAEVKNAVLRRPWAGTPLEFPFAVEVSGDADQCAIIARVWRGDAQVGIISFVRPASDSRKRAKAGATEEMRYHNRVFLSYCRKDEITVSRIATAYKIAGVDHFFDRSSLTPGEDWAPRLYVEIDKSDLFHLCWSRAAARSKWVQKEATHALERRTASGGKRPSITVQMLDGPPWAPHPPSLSAINFDDFVRAAIVGYARGDGS